jgi:hypothetical protein
MKLRFSKNQSSGLMGHVEFELRAVLEFTPEESELIDRYGIRNSVLVNREFAHPQTGRHQRLVITLEALMAGQLIRCTDIDEASAYEALMKQACDEFHRRLLAMQAFTGEQEIQF